MNFKDFYEESKSSDGTFVSAELFKTSQKELYEWAKSNLGLDESQLTPADKYHITVLYSKKTVPEDRQINDKVTLLAHPKHFKLFKSDGNDCLVLELDSPELPKYHQRLIDAGGTHDFPNYIPHVTLAYKVEPNFDLTKLKLPNFLLYIKEIKSNPIDPNWEKKLNEEA